MRLGVLSIDWDYFINATIEERVTLFPDGGNENLTYAIQNIIWCSRYSESCLKSIKTDRKAISGIKKVVDSIKERVSCILVKDSHKWIYDFVNDELDNNDYDGINLVNVDFHHDCYGISDEFPEVNCGNWLSFLSKEYYNIDALWIRRNDSDINSINNVENLINGLRQSENIHDATDFLSKCDRVMIFICRSGMWSPPHLDVNFNKMCVDIIDRVTNRDVKVNYDFEYNRYNKTFKSNVEGLSFVMNAMRMNYVEKTAR